MIRAAFLDIDGTLQSFTTHAMPDSAKRALAALRERGVRCYVATGRAPYEFPASVTCGFEGFDGFDGFVSLTGSLCYDADGPYHECLIDPADVEAVVSQVRAGRYEALVMEGGRDYVSGHGPAVRELERAAGLTYPEGDISQALGARVYQVCAFVPPEREAEIAATCRSVQITRWNDYVCDLVPRASGKPAGIRATLEHVGLAPEEAIAFGDGGNDESMLAFCGIGVAMGNARPQTKALADYVTTDVDDDGIWNACRELGLI